MSTNNKIKNLKEIEYITNFNLLGEHIVKNRKAKPNNKALDEMYYALQSIGFYVHNLITEERLYEQSLSEFRADKIRAVERARRSELKIIELEQKLQKLKKEKSLGL